MAPIRIALAALCTAPSSPWRVRRRRRPAVVAADRRPRRGQRAGGCDRAGPRRRAGDLQPHAAARHRVPAAAPEPADGSVLSSTGVDLGDAAIAPFASDAIAVAGTSIGPSGTIDDESRVRAGSDAGGGRRAHPAHALGHPEPERHRPRGQRPRRRRAATRGLRSRLIFLRRKGTTTFSRVLTINVSSNARDVTVALSPDGQLLVVLEDRHEVFARHRGTSGSWGAVHTLGPGVQSNLQAAMDSTGRMLVAWKSQRVNEGESNAPAVVSFITAAPGHGFGSRRTIETVGQTGAGRFVGAPGVRLAVTGSDQALLAWTGFDGTNFVVRAMPISRGRLGTRQVLSPSGTDAVLGDIAAATDGRALALWRSAVAGADPVAGQQPHLFGNVRAAAATTFGGPEAVGGAATEVLSPPTAAIDPQTRRPIALFTDFLTSRALVSVRPPTVP